MLWPPRMGHLGEEGGQASAGHKERRSVLVGTTLHFQLQVEPGDTLAGTVWKGASARGGWIEHLWSGPELSPLGGRSWAGGYLTVGKGEREGQDADIML